MHNNKFKVIFGGREEKYQYYFNDMHCLNLINLTWYTIML